MSAKLVGDWGRFSGHLDKMVKFGFTELHKKIGEALVSSTKERFSAEKSPDGKVWKKSRRAQAEGGQTLSDTGRLRSSIAFRATPEGVEVGTNVKYAGVHQGDNGKDITIKTRKAKFLRFKTAKGWVQKKSVTIPVRPFLGISNEDLEEIESIINRHIERKLR